MYATHKYKISKLIYHWQAGLFEVEAFIRVIIETYILFYNPVPILFDEPTMSTILAPNYKFIKKFLTE
jgi:hypothetical protein